MKRPTTRRGRSPSERTREKIRNANLLHRLIKFIEGDLEMTSVQVNAALKLLNKITPDLKAVDMKVTDDRRADQMDIHELADALREAEGVSSSRTSH